ncbi:hypothetical protein [Burkholderia gladioli]|uniref:hypothetical protein n=1 Tax=Burkholderia gladioli TaxID=28095 RepID=UPI0005C6FBFC|nr:hypothetical protein [Burkholderia gladioli]MBW5285895.1 hypothetical protein [Burkholderia gladioli]
MKANELSKLLRQAADLLDLYDGKDVRHMLDDLIKIKSQSSQQRERAKPRARPSPEQERVRLKEFASWCGTADLREIEAAIQSDELFAVNENIRALANILGIDLGKRQSRDGSIQTLMSYLDRSRMHQVISRRSSPETSPRSAVADEAAQAAEELLPEKKGVDKA